MENEIQDGSALTESEFIYYLKVNDFEIERISDDNSMDIKDNISESEIHKLIYKKVPTEYVGNATLVKLFCKEYKVVNIIDIIDMYVDYNDMGVKYGLTSLYKILNYYKEDEANELVNYMITNFYENPIKLNNMFYLVKENN